MTCPTARMIALKAFTDQDLIDELVERRLEWLPDEVVDLSVDGLDETLPLD